jgi:hypothetical protein
MEGAFVKPAPGKRPIAARYEKALALAGVLTAAVAARARAAEGDRPTVEIHGFVSQGALVTTGNEYLTRSKRGSLGFAEAGINFSTQLSERLRLGLQFFAHNLGTLGDYRARADWFYMDYRWRDWLGIRAGRTKVPFGLYNETSDIDAARVPILLPQAVYPIANRDYLLAQTGLELYGFLRLGPAGALEYRLYGGTIFIDLPPSLIVKNVDVPYLVGGRLMWETPVEGLRAGGSIQALRLTFDYMLDPTMPAVPATTLGADVILGVASVELVRRELTLAAELSQWRTTIDTEDLPIYPPGTKRVTVSERAYVSGAYRLARWLWPGAYYSVLFPDEARATFTGPSQDMQHDVAGTLRFDLNANWLVKLEAHYVHGTAGLSTELNAVPSLAALTRDWAVFLAKTTAYF